MKNIIRFMLLAALIISAQSLFAKNKDRIRISNNYGEDVTLHLTWRSDSFMGSKALSGLNFDRHQDVLLKEHHEDYELTAPLSSYKLYEIDATPASNVEDPMTAVMSQRGSNEYVSNWEDDYNRRAINNSSRFADEMGSVGSAINKSLNHDVLKVRHQDKFFIIEKSHKPSGVPGQNKIIIKEFNSEKIYNQRVAKNQSVTEQVEPIVKQKPQAPALRSEFIDHYYGKDKAATAQMMQFDDNFYRSNDE